MQSVKQGTGRLSRDPPEVTTSSMDKPRLWAMNPSTENTTKPAKMLVALLRQQSARQSLQHGQQKRSV